MKQEIPIPKQETPDPYRGLNWLTQSESSHLGGNSDDGDPFSFSPSAWDYLINRFAITSLLDLGSGIGSEAVYFQRKGLAVVAVDGLMQNIEKALYPTVCIDLTKSPVVTRVDLVFCQELVEHIEEKYVDNIVASFKSGKFVCMTHALPGQPGYHHVNCRPDNYWIKIMEDNGFLYLSEDTSRVRTCAERDGARYLLNSGLVFRNSSR